jgi:hypothetical protein
MFAIGHHAPSPWLCNNKPGSDYSPAENICVVRRVFNGTGYLNWKMAIKVARCESGLDEKQVTPPFSAKGLYQYLQGTWNGIPHYSKHSVFNPVWASLATRWYVKHDRGWAGQWYASKPCWGAS